MKFAVLIPSVLIFQSNESEEPGLWKSIQIQGHQPAKSGPYFKTKGFLSARQWLQAHSRLWHPPISSTDILGFIPVHSWVWDLGCQSSFSCLLLRHSYFGHRTRQPLTHWPDACMLSSVGGQSSHDPEVRVWWLSPWLAFLCLKGDCIRSTFRIYTIHHGGDRPRECERHRGKPGCPTSRKTKPSARLWRVCGWGPRPAAGVIPRLNFMAIALYRSPVPVSLVSTNLRLRRKSRLRLCMCVLISSPRQGPALCPEPGRWRPPYPCSPQSRSPW